MSHSLAHALPQVDFNGPSGFFNDRQFNDVNVKYGLPKPEDVIGDQTSYFQPPSLNIPPAQYSPPASQYIPPVPQQYGATPIPVVKYASLAPNIQPAVYQEPATLPPPVPTPPHSQYQVQIHYPRPSAYKTTVGPQKKIATLIEKSIWGVLALKAAALLIFGNLYINDNFIVRKKRDLKLDSHVNSTINEDAVESFFEKVSFYIIIELKI